MGGSDKGLQGPRWPIYGPMPQVMRVERRNGAIGSVKRVSLVLTLLDSG